MIVPVGREQQAAPSCYQIVACSELPAFDPVPTLKTLVLSSQGVKRFNGLVFKSRHLFMPSFSLGVVLRFAAFAAPAPVGRVLAPVSALLHAPSIVMFLSGIRTEFANIVLRTFDCWILIVANALWLIVLSAVLGDLRVLLVVTCWAQFTNALLQETYMHVSRNIGLLALGEALFLVLLMMSLSAGLLDDVQHYDLIATRNHTLSSKDVLVNVSGTMATLMLRTTYRRLQQAQHQKDDAGSAMQSLQFHCRIALQAMKASITTQSSVVPTVGPLLRGTSKVEVAPEDLFPAVSTQINRSSKQPLPLQMTLATASGRFDSQQTVWPCIGSEKPLANWQFAAFHACGATAIVLSWLSYFPPRTWSSHTVNTVAGLGLTLSATFCAVHTCCCQRQLLKRVMSSFDYLFLAFQLIAAHLCLCDVFYWRPSACCGVFAGLFWAQSTLTVDALTPNMKQRLGLKTWMPTCGILMFMTAQALLMLSILIWGKWDLQDRLLWDFELAGRHVEFHVVPFLLSRLVTIFIWCTRILYALVTRRSDDVLILLRGCVEFDYQRWRLQARMPSAPRTQHTGGEAGAPTREP